VRHQGKRRRSRCFPAIPSVGGASSFSSRAWASPQSSFSPARSLSIRAEPHAPSSRSASGDKRTGRPCTARAAGRGTRSVHTTGRTLSCVLGRYSRVSGVRVPPPGDRGGDGPERGEGPSGGARAAGGAAGTITGAAATPTRVRLSRRRVGFPGSSLGRGAAGRGVPDELKSGHSWNREAPSRAGYGAMHRCQDIGQPPIGPERASKDAAGPGDGRLPCGRGPLNFLGSQLSP
jgi:hypothetical protein